MWPSHNKYVNLIKIFYGFFGLCQNKQTLFYLRTSKIFPWIISVTTNIVIRTFFSVIPLCLPTKVEIITDRNSFLESFAGWQSFNSRSVFQMVTDIISKIKVSTTQSAWCFPSNSFAKIFKLKKTQVHIKGQSISKAIFLKTPLPQNKTRYLTKFCLMKLGQNFVKYFVHFLGNWVSRKNAFEIYWPQFCKFDMPTGI